MLPWNFAPWDLVLMTLDIFLSSTIRRDVVARN